MLLRQLESTLGKDDIGLVAFTEPVMEIFKCGDLLCGVCRLGRISDLSEKTQRFSLAVVLGFLGIFYCHGSSLLFRLALYWEL